MWTGAGADIEAVVERLLDRQRAADLAAFVVQARPAAFAAEIPSTGPGGHRQQLRLRVCPAQRYGQRNTAQVYNLVLSDTIEGSIFLLLDQKLAEVLK